MLSMMPAYDHAADLSLTLSWMSTYIGRCLIGPLSLADEAMLQTYH